MISSSIPSSGANVDDVDRREPILGNHTNESSNANTKNTSSQRFILQYWFGVFR